MAGRFSFFVGAADIRGVRINGTEGQRRGRDAEAHVYNVLRLSVSDRGWLRGVRRATPREDAEGIDLVLLTPAGVVELQIKAGKRKGLARYREKGIAVISAPPKIRPWDLELRVRMELGIVEKLRAELVARGKVPRTPVEF